MSTSTRAGERSHVPLRSCLVFMCCFCQELCRGTPVLRTCTRRTAKCPERPRWGCVSWSKQSCHSSTATPGSSLHSKRVKVSQWRGHKYPKLFLSLSLGSIKFTVGQGKEGIIDFISGSELLIAKAKNGHLTVVSGRCGCRDPGSSPSFGHSPEGTAPSPAGALRSASIWQSPGSPQSPPAIVLPAAP